MVLYLRIDISTWQMKRSSNENFYFLHLWTKYVILRKIPHGACELVVHDGEDGLDVTAGESFRSFLKIPAHDAGEAMLRPKTPRPELSCADKQDSDCNLKILFTQLP